MSGMPAIRETGPGKNLQAVAVSTELVCLLDARERRSDKMRQQRISLFRIRLIFVIAIILIRTGAAKDGIQNPPFHRNTILLKRLRLVSTSFNVLTA